MRALLAVAAVAFLAFPHMAFAQDTTPAATSQFADPSCPTLAEVTAILDKNHETYVVLDVTDLLNVATETPSHVIVSTVGAVATLGYEVQGCVTGPIGLAKILPKHTT